MKDMKKTIKSMGTLIILFSIIVFSGGLLGFIMKNSLPSLSMGTLFGLTLLLGGVKTYTLHKWGLYLSFSLILLLDFFFSYRFVTTMSFMPAGLMLLISTATFIVLLLKLRTFNDKSKTSTN